MFLENIKQKALKKQNLTFEECVRVIEFPNEDILLLLNAAYDVRKKFVGNTVQVQLLKNIKSGKCSEDCHYCSQSSISQADIEKYPLKPLEEIYNNAKIAKENKAIRYCMAMSSVKYSDKTIDVLANSIKKIKEDIGIELCCSLGFLTPEQAIKLKKAGLDRVNHNLNTSKDYYPSICTTHKYEQRVANIKLCQDTGLEICSGGIIGQGESKEDIISMFLELKQINPNSIPLNFLIPVKGTPFENKSTGLNPLYCLKILCLARFMFPDKDIRAAGGREYHLRSLQPLALYAANSIFVSGYLTTDGQSIPEGLKMVEDMGFDIEIEGSD